MLLLCLCLKFSPNHVFVCRSTHCRLLSVVCSHFSPADHFVARSHFSTDHYVARSHRTDHQCRSLPSAHTTGDSRPVLGKSQDGVSAIICFDFIDKKTAFCKHYAHRNTDFPQIAVLHHFSHHLTRQLLVIILS